MKAMRLLIGAFTCAVLLAVAPGWTAGLKAGATTPVRQTAESEQGVSTTEFRFARGIFRLGQDYTLPADEAVRDVRTIFGSLTIEGKVEGDVVAVLGTVQVASTASIHGSLVVVGGNATIQPGASVGRDLVVVGGALDAPPSFSPGGEHVVIGMRGLGSALQGIVPWFTRGLLWGRLIVPSLPWMWGLVGVLFFVGLILNLLLDGPVKASAVVIATKPLSAFLAGLLVMLLAGPLLVLLAASVIGLIVVPFAACALVAASILGKIAVARAIGSGIVHESDEDGSRVQGLRSFVIGSAVLILAYMVPIIGLLTWVTTGALGLGAATMTFFVALRRERPPSAPRTASVPPTAPLAVPAPPVTEATMVSAAATPEWTPAGQSLDEPLKPATAVAGAPAASTLGDVSLYPRASFLDRVAAFALDCVLVAIANGFLNVRDHDGGPFFLLLLAYHIGFWAWKGTTLGGIIVGLRVVRTTGTELRFVDALVRGLASIFSLAALGIGCFWMLQDADRQMWHDKIAGTNVLKVPRELVLA